MKKKLLKIFYFTLSKFCVFKFFYWVNRNKQIVITYHNIIPDYLFDNTVHLGMSHSQSVFEKQIEHIKKRFHPITEKKILITFDDGYKNQFEISASILNKYNLKGTYFITFKLLIEQFTLTVDRMMQWISYVPMGSYKILNRVYEINDSNRQGIASHIYVKLLGNFQMWDTIETELDQAYPFEDLKIDPELKRLRFDAMCEEDLINLASNGHTIAAHSWDHKPLSTMSMTQQKRDFALSKKYADRYCNSSWYSYPYGGKDEVSQETAKICEEYGFTAGFMNISDFSDWKNIKKEYRITRFSLPNYVDPYVIDAKLSGFEFFIKRLIQKNIKGKIWTRRNFTEC